MSERLVKLLRVPLLHNCPFYDEQNADADVMIYFYITKETFNQFVAQLASSNHPEKGYIVEDLTSHSVWDVHREADLDSMRFIFENISPKLIKKVEIIYPKQFKKLYADYLKTRPYVMDKAGRRWLINQNSKEPSKEEFLWTLYRGEFRLG